MTKLEEVALAIGRVLEDAHEMACKEAARAAIEAMREPTEAMMDAGWNAQPEDDIDGPLSVSVRAPYRAMIDAALGEEEKSDA